MYYPLAQQEFESYLNGYDRENDRIKLKIIHTYGVVKQAEELAGSTKIMISFLWEEYVQSLLPYKTADIRSKVRQQRSHKCLRR